MDKVSAKITKDTKSVSISKYTLLNLVLNGVIGSFAPGAFAAEGAVSQPPQQTQQPVQSSIAQPTQVEQYLMSKGSKITLAFPSQSGMKAIVVDNGAQKRLFYITPDGKGLVAGLLFDATGNNVTVADLNRAGVRDTGGAATVSQAQWDQIWQEAGQLSYIEEGTAGPVVYVFFDANCPYCHRLYSNLRQYVAAGRVRVRWLPVAILAESSKSLAAAIYQSAAPKDTLSKMVNWQLLPASTITQEVNSRLAHDLVLMSSTGFTGVPVILYQQGGHARGVNGALDPDEIVKIL